MSDDPRYTYTRKWIGSLLVLMCDECGALIDPAMQSDHTAMHEGQDLAVSAVLWVQRKQREEIIAQQNPRTDATGYQLTDPWRSGSNSHR